MDVERNKRRVCIKFCFLNCEKLQTGTPKLKNIIWWDVMSCTTVFDWFGQFENGGKSADNDESSGRSSTSTTSENTVKVHGSIYADRGKKIHDICPEVGTGYGPCQQM